MPYNVVVNDEVGSRIAAWEIHHTIKMLFYALLDEELTDGKPNGVPAKDLEGCVTHRIRLADPDINSTAVYHFVAVVQTIENTHRIVDAAYFRKGGPRGLVL